MKFYEANSVSWVNHMEWKNPLYKSKKWVFVVILEAESGIFESKLCHLFTNKVYFFIKYDLLMRLNIFHKISFLVLNQWIFGLMLYLEFPPVKYFLNPMALFLDLYTILWTWSRLLCSKKILNTFRSTCDNAVCCSCVQTRKLHLQIKHCYRKDMYRYIW